MNDIKLMLEKTITVNESLTMEEYQAIPKSLMNKFTIYSEEVKTHRHELIQGNRISEFDQHLLIKNVALEEKIVYHRDKKIKTEIYTIKIKVFKHQRLLFVNELTNIFSTFTTVSNNKTNWKKEGF